MKAHHSPSTLAQRLGLLPVTQEEVAVLQFGAALSEKELRALLPPATVLLDLAALQKGHWVTQRRLELAHAFVVLTDRSETETEALLTAFRAPDHILQVKDLPNQERLRQELEGTVSMLCGLILKSNTTNASSEELDYMGLKCPMPIVRLSAHVRKNTPSTVDILADDRAFPADLKAWAERSDAQIEWLSPTDAPPFRARLHFQAKKQAIPHAPSSSFVIQLPPELLQQVAQNKTPSVSFTTASLSASSSGSLATESLSNRPESVGQGLPLLAELDYNDKRSPLHLVALQKDLKRFPQPGLLLIHTRDPQFLQDLRHWCEQKEAHVVKTSQQNNQVMAWVAINQGSTKKEAQELATNDNIPTFASSAVTLKQESLSVNPRTTHVGNNILSRVTPIEALMDLPLGFSSKSSGTLQALSKSPNGPSSFPMESFPPSKEAFGAFPASKGLLEEEPIALNFCGLKCPMPIVQLSKQVREHPKHPLKVSADDPAFPVDLKAWCDIHGYSVQKEQQSGHIYHAWLHKA